MSDCFQVVEVLLPRLHLWKSADHQRPSPANGTARLGGGDGDSGTQPRQNITESRSEPPKEEAGEKTESGRWDWAAMTSGMSSCRGKKRGGCWLRLENSSWVGGQSPRPLKPTVSGGTDRDFVCRKSLKTTSKKCKWGLSAISSTVLHICLRLDVKPPCKKKKKEKHFSNQRG